VQTGLHSKRYYSPSYSERRTGSLQKTHTGSKDVSDEGYSDERVTDICRTSVSQKYTKDFTEWGTDFSIRISKICLSTEGGQSEAEHSCAETRHDSGHSLYSVSIGSLLHMDQSFHIPRLCYIHTEGVLLAY
jgi:hypothetical protein